MRTSFRLSMIYKSLAVLHLKQTHTIQKSPSQQSIPACCRRNPRLCENDAVGVGEIYWTASHGSIWSLFVASLVCGICKSAEWEGCVCVYVCLAGSVCGKVKELILSVSQGRRGPFSRPPLLWAHPTTTAHCMPLLKTRTLCFLFVSKSPLTPPPVYTQTL